MSSAHPDVSTGIPTAVSPENTPRRATESRRDFLRTAATVTAGAAVAPIFGVSARAADGGEMMAIVADAEDRVVRQAPVGWAIGQLRATLTARGLDGRIVEALEQVQPGSDCVLVTSGASKLSRQFLRGVGITPPRLPESIVLYRRRFSGRKVLLACGSDARGLVYALMELADLVDLADDPLAILRSVGSVSEQPANRIRSVARLFTSETEDKAWFNDRDFWRKYLTMLAAQRFNRFSLTLGIGYDFATGLRDTYFYFAYPFLVSTPGYNVRATALPDEERRANLEMLRFISDEAALRGLHFQLGLWTHAYQWANSPRANYVIDGLTPETHAAYCRDSLRLVLESCPSIQGVTLRIHGESGVPEGSYDFWRAVFAGMAGCGRTVELDMHAKGMDQETIDVAMASGLPLVISPKFWAEHLGLPYMQASIRRQEMPPANARDAGFFSRSSGSRRFLRYGYGDLLAKDRKYGILHRVWPGTQRLLLWGSPAMASAYGSSFGFCGGDGFELFEPLSFKGRKGSGLPGGRDAYADESLREPGGGWEKYLYTYRLWGRLTYHPAAPKETWRRLLRKRYGAAALAVEEALAHASRVLPLVTTAHCPSAANNNYWPEMYTNMSIPEANRPSPYDDTSSPKRFGTVSPLDPELFAGVDEWAGRLLEGAGSPKYSPGEVAQWLHDLAEVSLNGLAEAERTVTDRRRPEFRRLAADVSLQAGLGRFFAWKFRAGVLYAIYDRSLYPAALEEALKAYREARAAWSALAAVGDGVYARDITFGYDKQLRGSWADRLAAIDADISATEGKLAGVTSGVGMPKIDPAIAARAVVEVLVPVRRPEVALKHAAPQSFRRGHPLNLKISVGRGVAASIWLHYRRVNQAETWRAVEMRPEARRFAATIPSETTDSPFSLQYYFELRGKEGVAWQHPGLGANLTAQPYFVVEQA